jgi:thiol-disulfide isomerase/thioredoxin
MPSKTTYFWIAAIIVVALILVGIYSTTSLDTDEVTNLEDQNPLPEDNENSQQNPDPETTNEDSTTTDPPESRPLWLNRELADSVTGETFTIGGFDVPVLFESFAVWCPKCKAQQEELKEFHTEPGFSEEEIISISLGTDPNEDAEQVKNHAESNGFDWRFAISPIEVTQDLIDEFGPGIVSAPSVPMVVVCPDQTFQKLDSGHKTIEELKEAVAFCG